MDLVHRLLTIAGSIRLRQPLHAPRAEVPKSWAEDYLLGVSDADARWYYERRSWRSVG
jgi:hypothetical protein